MSRALIGLSLLLLMPLGCDDDGEATPTTTADVGGGGGGGGSGGGVVDPDDGVPALDSGVSLDRGVDPQQDAALEPDADVSGDPLAAWSRDYAAAQCGVMFRCGVPSMPWADEAACREALKDENYGGAHIAEAISGGAMRFNEGAAAACLSGLAALDCVAFFAHISQTFSAFLPECAEALVGLHQADQPCPLGLECAAGYACDRAAGCPGRCVAYPAIGAACEGICDPSAATCHMGICVSMPQVGGPCLENGDCPAPMACDLGTGTCAAAALEGQPCGAGCLFGLICVGDICVRPADIDGDCFSDYDCELGLICAGGICDLPPSAGAPCHEGYACDGASFCDGAQLPPTCAPLPGLGASCETAFRCDGAVCVNNRCVAALADGAACQTYIECGSGRCEGGVCVAVGEPPCQP
ncbi:hypothetical protein KKF91_19750 [Myxococcota bacterium]|nr:hypothetical protein [Myxococcota bacterium]